MPPRSVGPYELEEKLGEGGMGEVFRAFDPRLKRQVAIKFLTDHAHLRDDLRQRFHREAQAASRLNHPNIISIYDFGFHEGREYFVMEYIRGSTLDQIISTGRLAKREVLRIAIAVVSALSRAHENQILHRDLKPSNIIVSDDGSVKLLDFGLAKESEPPSDETRTIDAANDLTQEGRFVGTANYVSPEQAQGRSLDARSDIFSFGAVLYEMVTGHKAFQGPSVTATLASILRDQPEAPSRIIPNVSPALERVILRCLRKDPGKRYQHAVDLLVELEDIEEELRSSSDVNVVSLRRQWSWLLIPLAILAAGAVALLLQHSPAGVQSDIKRIALTTAPGIERQPSLSPDGNQVVFVAYTEGTNSDVYAKVIGSTASLRLTSDPAPEQYPVWSPDGLQIAFIRATSSGQLLHVMSALGGQARPVSSIQAYGKPSWSPDGRWLAVGGSGTPSSMTASAYLISVESGEARKILTPPPLHSFRRVVFSPDGRKLALVRCRGVFSCSVLIQHLTRDLAPEGIPEEKTDDTENIASLAWTHDSRRVVIGSTPALNTGYRLKEIVLSTRRITRIDAAGPGANMADIAFRADRLAFEVRSQNLDVWRIEQPGVPTLFLSSTQNDENVSYSPDGTQIVFSSHRGGQHSDIWIADSNGANPRQITASFQRHTGSPRWSPDGRTILFDAMETDGSVSLWTVPTGGGSPTRLTGPGHRDARPTWSRDGRWIYFISNRQMPEGTAVWKLNLESRELVQITDFNSDLPQESRDGSILYFLTWAHGENHLIARDLRTLVDRTIPIKSKRVLGFCPAPRTIYYTAPLPPSGFEIRTFDLRTSTERVVASLSGSTGADIAVAPNNKTIVFSRSEPDNADVFLLDGFR